MSDVNQVSLPENFYDFTSPQLLAQPEPQFLYATMFMAAMGLSLNPEAALGLQGRAIVGSGAAYSAAERDRLIMADPLMTGLVAAKVDFKGLPGSTVRINRPQFADTTYTEASREVGLNTSISTTTINAGSEQVSLTLRRFAGPYDSVNSRVAPYGIDKFAAGMGVHSLSSLVGTHLKRDFHKFLDATQVVLLDLASSTVRPSGMTADNDATVAGQFPMDYDTINRAELTADEANLPCFPDGYRLLVLTPKQCAQLKTDPDYVELSKVHPQYNALFPQYVASVGKLHIFKSTTLNQSNNSSSIPVHKGHLLAPGALLGGMGAAPRVAPSTDDNYGEVAKVIWVAYLGLGLADNRFCVSVRSA
jgi:hypothetical protein